MMINQHFSLLQAFNSYQTYTKRSQDSMTKLSTGSRINKASDDSSGLMMSERFRMQTRGIEQVQGNIQDAKSLIDVADGALDIMGETLGRVHELALKASNETLGADEKLAIQVEVNELLNEVDSIAGNTKFNGVILLNGDADIDVTVSADGSEMNLDIRNMATNNLGYTGTTLNLFKTGGTRDLTLNSSNAKLLASNVSKAIRQIATERGELGAKSNRLDFRVEGLKNEFSTIAKAESRIRDVDVAKETMELTKNQMLAQASMTMMAQGMQHQQSVLMLLR
ncbi:hypothetical protein JMA_44400 (plasmid) [Jeotgalibacillus malaysiensis]|uniref:Flagellin n=1 Tax=Jeotgalibacillus malaysiensis TaxID=1508404 RepID=A0A0B5AYL8_9BACL|nr:flagellin [Jeotgalibacillus malaysiensis]AJD93757.1 hypothetical protein JMA_44400 [Jeotgalibacillus malaysiensis]